MILIAEVKERDERRLPPVWIEDSDLVTTLKGPRIDFTNPPWFEIITESPTLLSGLLPEPVTCRVSSTNAVGDQVSKKGTNRPRQIGRGRGCVKRTR